MKKLVTLFAIALTGATIGVGSSFAWWSDDSKAESDQSKTKAEDVASPVSPPVTQTDVLVPVTQDNQPLGVLQFFGSGEVPVLALTNDGAAVPPYEQLADQLDAEAKDLEKQGKTDAAELQHRLANRLRKAAPRPTEHGARIVGESQPMRPIKLPNEEAIRHIKMQIDRLYEQLKRMEATGSKERAGRELELTFSQPSIVLQEGPDKQPRQVRVERMPGKILFQDNRANDAAAADLAGVIHELNEVADGLEKSGQMDQAHAIRSQVKQLQRSTKRRAAEAAIRSFSRGQTGNEKDSGARDREKQEADSRVRNRQGELRVEIREPNKAPQAGDRPRDDRRDAEIHGYRIVQEDISAAGGHPQLGEIHHMLHELRREIAELREQVRDLRAKLSPEKQPTLHRRLNIEVRPGKANRETRSDNERQNAEKERPDADSHQDAHDDEKSDDDRKAKSEDEQRDTKTLERQ